MYLQSELMLFLVSFWISSVLITDLTSIFHQQQTACISANIHCQMTITVFRWMKHKEVKQQPLWDTDSWAYLQGWQRRILSPSLGQFQHQVLLGSQRETEGHEDRDEAVYKDLRFFVCLLDGTWGGMCTGERLVTMDWAALESSPLLDEVQPRRQARRQWRRLAACNWW